MVLSESSTRIVWLPNARSEAFTMRLLSTTFDSVSFSTSGKPARLMVHLNVNGAIPVTALAENVFVDSVDSITTLDPDGDVEPIDS